MIKWIVITIAFIIILTLLGLTIIGHFRLGTLSQIATNYQKGDHPYKIVGHAMDPNFKDGQYWLGVALISNPQRGDVVVFKSPENQSQILEKRVIGLPGDKVMIKGGLVYLNGQVLQEPYLAANTQTATAKYPGEGQEITVPDSSYYILGDNRPNSYDSRQFGFVPAANLISKLTTCYKNCP